MKKMSASLPNNRLLSTRREAMKVNKLKMRETLVSYAFLITQ